MSKQETDAGVLRRFTVEQRAKPRIEMRGEGGKQQAVAVGYAAVFYDAADPGTEYRIYDDMVERIMPEAFNAAIAEQDDVRALCNHDPTQLLGRTKNGTCRLSVDGVGLRYEIDLPDTQAGRDCGAMLQRGDMDGSSFGFLVYSGKRGKVTWSQESADGQTTDVREIHSVELLDVGPVTYPAYASTSAGMRSRYAEEARADRERWRAERAAVDFGPELDFRIAEATAALG